VWIKNHVDTVQCSILELCCSYDYLCISAILYCSHPKCLLTSAISAFNTGVSLQHWEGLPLLLPSGIAKKGSGNAWTAFKNPQNKRQVSVKVCSPFCAPEMRGHSNLRVLRFLGLHKRKSRNHTVQNSQTLRTKCAELGLLDECLGSVGLKSKISPFFFLE
jgi:hypothetical protein